MKKRYFWQVDAFSKNRYYGNPAAVVFDAEGLSQETMQRIAREMNLSETVFVLPPTEPIAHYWSRIFTPQSELPFAGHPTLATAYAMLTSKRVTPAENVLRQQCGIGIVPVTFEREGDDVRFAMTQGEPAYRDAEVRCAWLLYTLLKIILHELYALLHGSKMQAKFVSLSL